MILCADIGGTKTLLGIGRNGRLLDHRRYANADFPDFAALLAHFLDETGTDAHGLDAASLALAGPIADDGASARLTNLPWTVSADHLVARFGIPVPRLVNDFAAAALGAVTATPDHFVTLQVGDPLTGAPRLVVGAGTGLGMAIVLPDGERWRCIPGEGGHVAFAPADEIQDGLLDFLRLRHGRVTWERVASGPGLAAIGEYLSGAAMSPERIVERARANAAGVERRALELFLAAYGAYAGDMALACLARGGVFLAGGIAAAVADLLPQSGFCAAFGAKAEHAGLAARMPVHVVTDPLLGLRGALLSSCDGKL